MHELILAYGETYFIFSSLRRAYVDEVILKGERF